MGEKKYTHYLSLLATLDYEVRFDLTDNFFV